MRKVGNLQEVSQAYLLKCCKAKCTKLREKFINILRYVLAPSNYL
jgi:hypothetical protein